MTRSWLRDAAAPMVVARIVVGVVYVWFGLNKLVDPIAFLKAMREYDILPLSPPQVLNVIAIVLPWLEVLCGLLLLVGAWLRAAGALLGGMTVVFTLAVSLRAFDQAARTGVGLCDVGFDCGCGIGHVWFCTKVAENAALVLLAAVVFCSRSRALSLEAIAARPSLRQHARDEAREGRQHPF